MWDINTYKNYLSHQLILLKIQENDFVSKNHRKAMIKLMECLIKDNLVVESCSLDEIEKLLTEQDYPHVREYYESIVNSEASIARYFFDHEANVRIARRHFHHESNIRLKEKLIKFPQSGIINKRKVDLTENQLFVWGQHNDKVTIDITSDGELIYANHHVGGRDVPKHFKFKDHQALFNFISVVDSEMAEIDESVIPMVLI